MPRSNAFRHYTVTVSNGETYPEKCRDSLGGYSNLVQRIAARHGGVCRLTAADGSTSAQFVIEGSAFEGSAITGIITEVRRATSATETREYRVAISGPYVIAHNRTVSAFDERDAEDVARSEARDAGLDLLYASVSAFPMGAVGRGSAR